MGVVVVLAACALACGPPKGESSAGSSGEVDNGGYSLRSDKDAEPQDKDDAMKKPTHDQIVSAVARSQDRELELFVEGPDSYVVRKTEIDGAREHQVFRVLLGEAAHPMSFFIATRSDRDPFVLSQNLRAVRDFLRDEPALWTAEGLPQRFFELYRHQGVHSRVLDLPEPSADKQDDGYWLRLGVEIDGDKELWLVDLPPRGEPELHVRELSP